MGQLSGGCLCGAVRYRLDGEPVMVAACHCRTCQKNNGSAFSINVAMPEDAVEISGNSLRTYESRAGADGEAFYRSFCSSCGSPISGRGGAYPGIVFIKAGTLDDPSAVEPTVHIWGSEKRPWLRFSEEVPQLSEGPGSAPVQTARA